MSAFAALAASASDVIVAAPPNGKAGPVALFILVLLGAAVYFLCRSMSRHLRRVPEEFAPPTAQGAETAQPAPPDAPGDAR